MRAFQLSTIVMPLPLMVFRYIAKEVSNPRYALESEVFYMTCAELEASDEKARDNVNKWCRDLLELKSYRGAWSSHQVTNDVQFLHRTVKDFLLRREMQQHFAKHPICRSSPRQAMCMIFLAECKRLSGFQTEEDQRSFTRYVDEGMTWALKCEEVDEEPATEILDELGRVRQLVSGNLDTSWDHNDRLCSMAHYAVHFGLRLYVSRCLDRDPETEAGILWHALPFFRTTSSMDGVLAMFTLLLEKNVDPNQLRLSHARPHGDTTRETTWQHFLAHNYDCTRLFLRELAQTWIRHGADLNTTIKVSGSVHRRDVRTCLLMSEDSRMGGEFPGWADELLAEGRAKGSASLLSKLPETSIETS